LDHREVATAGRLPSGAVPFGARQSGTMGVGAAPASDLGSRPATSAGLPFGARPAVSTFDSAVATAGGGGGRFALLRGPTGLLGWEAADAPAMADGEREPGTYTLDPAVPPSGGRSGRIRPGNLDRKAEQLRERRVGWMPQPS
jgi:hypothetical protein